MPLGMEDRTGQTVAQATLCSIETQLPPGKGTPTLAQFLTHVYCGQTAGWIKMPLCTEVYIGAGEVVLDGVAVPPPLKGAHPKFPVHVYYGPDG